MFPEARPRGRRRARPRSPTSAPGTRTSRRRRSAANSDAIIDYINGHGGTELHPDFGSPREYGIPYRVVGKRAKRTKVRFTAYGDESDHGKYRVPLNAPVEGGAARDGDRHVLAYDRARCKLYELYRAFPAQGPRSAGRPTPA